MTDLLQAYNLGSRMAANDAFEKVALAGLIRGAGSLIAKGYQAAAPRAASAFAAGRNSKTYGHLAKNVRHLARDTLKSKMTYAMGGLQAYTTEGDIYDKAKAFAVGGLIGGASYGLMGGAARTMGARMLGGRKLTGARLDSYISDLQSAGLKGSRARTAARRLNSANKYSRRGNLAGFDQNIKAYQKATEGLGKMDRLKLNLKYNKRGVAAGTFGVGAGFYAGDKAYNSVTNIAGMGPQQQERMYETQTSNYPPPPPPRSSTISGNNNPYSR